MKYSAFVFLLFIFQNLYSSEISGIAKIIDGDTIKIKNQNIRLIFIDAPELEQYCFNKQQKFYNCGKKSKQYLKRIINKKRVYCSYNIKDRYKRILGECFLKDKKMHSINYKMIESGWAVIYRRYSFPENYLKAENNAKKTRSGIWQGKFVLPERWRIKNK